MCIEAGEASTQNARLENGTRGTANRGRVSRLCCLLSGLLGFFLFLFCQSHLYNFCECVLGVQWVCTVLRVVSQKSKSLFSIETKAPHRSGEIPVTWTDSVALKTNTLEKSVSSTKQFYMGTPPPTEI